MGVGLVIAWAIVSLPVAIAVGLSIGQTLLLIVAGVAVAILLRRPIESAASRWRRGRQELEQRRGLASYRA